MAASFTVVPTDSNINFANQRLIYTCATDNASWTDAYRFVIIVQEGTSATQIAKVYLSKNPNNAAHFDLGQIVYNRRSVDTEGYGVTTVIHADNAKWYSKNTNNVNKYIVTVGEFDGTTEGSADATDTRYLCAGSRNIVDNDVYRTSMADFYGTADTKKYWLTDRVSQNNIIDVYVSDLDEGVVGFINRSVVTTVTKHKLSIYNASDVLLYTLDIPITASNGAAAPGATTQSSFLCYIDGFPNNIEDRGSYLSSYPTWAYYTYTPQDASSVDKGMTMKFILRCNSPKNVTTQLAWANTKGGWDYLSFDGKRKKTVKRQEKTYRKTIGNYNDAVFAYTTHDRELTPYHVDAQEEFTLNSVLTSDEFDLFQYCFRSKDIWMRYGDTDADIWKPVIMNTSSLQVHSVSESKIYTTSVSVKSSQYIQC